MNKKTELAYAKQFADAGYRICELEQMLKNSQQELSETREIHRQMVNVVKDNRSAYSVQWSNILSRMYTENHDFYSSTGAQVHPDTDKLYKYFKDRFMSEVEVDSLEFLYRAQLVDKGK